MPTGQLEGRNTQAHLEHPTWVCAVLLRASFEIEALGVETLATHFFAVIVERPLRIRFSGGFLGSLRFLNALHEGLSLAIFVGLGTFPLVFHGDSLLTTGPMMRGDRTEN
jgi:hypothetical protein